MNTMQCLLSRGGRVCMQAVPGAGKTSMMLDLLDEEETLILAYNKELAQRVNSKIADKENVVCFTFHSLCSRCLSLARDDRQLHEAVCRAERGELAPRNVPVVKRVFVDEAQDVRELYVRLLRVLGLCEDGIGMLVAGDRNQLIYDFDDEFPASTNTILEPELTFGGEWRRESMNMSHRLTSHMAIMVNEVFETSIEAKKEGPKIDVLSPRSMYNDGTGKQPSLFDLLKKYIKEGEEILLLVDYKNGNASLRSLLNLASRSGCSIHLHGVSSSPKEGSIECGTFWSAKGIESKTVIVLLPGRSPRNPTYVALTRSTHRLVLVLDPKNPNSLVSKAIQNNPSSFSILNDWTRGVVRKGCGLDPDLSFGCRFRAGERRLDMTSHIPPGMEGCSLSVEEEVVEEEGCRLSGKEDLCVRMCIVSAEYSSTGLVRGMECIRSPTRVNYEKISSFNNSAARNGFVGRSVLSFVSDDSLLADDLRSIAFESYSRMGGERDIAIVSLATLSWNSWDHMMRSSLSDLSWSKNSTEKIRFVQESIPPCSEFDTFLVEGETYCRVHASSDTTCFHVVWEASPDDASHAYVRSSLHKSKTCTLIEVGPLRKRVVSFNGTSFRDLL